MFMITPDDTPLVFHTTDTSMDTSNTTITNDVHTHTLTPCLVVGPIVEGTISFKNKVHCILNNYADRFRKTVGSEPAKVNPLVLQVNGMVY